MNCAAHILTRLVIWACILTRAIWGMGNSLYGQHIFPALQVKHGLTDNSIYAILEDQRGFIWIGTGEGLSRFDGYEFRNFEHESDNPYSLGGNGITSLFEDRSGNIWVGSFGGGVSVFNAETDRFIRYTHQPELPNSLAHDYAISFYEDPTGNMWVGTWGGVDRFDPETQGFVHYSPAEDDSVELISPLVNTLYQDKGGTMWIGTEAGLDRMRISPGREGEAEFLHLTETGLLGDNLLRKPVKYLYGDPLHDTLIWAGLANGVLRIALDASAGYTPRSIQHIRHDPDRPESLSGSYISKILRDQSGVLWIASLGGGLNRLTEPHKPGEPFQFTHMRHEAGKIGGLASDEVRSLYESPSGIKWIGYDLAGMQKWLPQADVGFAVWDHANWKPEDPQAGSITSVFRASPDSLWVGTYSSGLVLVNPLTGMSRTFLPNGKGQGPAHRLVTAICRDSAGTLWFGTFGGLSKWNPREPHFTNYYETGPDSLSLSDRHIFSLHVDGDTNLWIGTRGGGLNCLNLKTLTFRSYMHDPARPESISNNNVWLVIGDRKGGLWMSTDRGLEHFTPGENVFTHFVNDPAKPSSLSNNYVNGLLLDSQNRLWVGTDGSGLDLLEDSTGSFQHFGLKEGLPNAVIFGILEDRKGRLWLSTNYGLSCFNPDVSLTSAEFVAFRNYDVTHGLRDNEFTMGAYSKDKLGRLYFGGVKGLHAFDPDSLRHNSKIPAVYLTRLRILNETVEPEQVLRKGYVPLARSLLDTRELKLGYRENVVSFDFAALSHFYPENNRYAYRLEGFDEDWVYSGNERRATYTNLDAGTYVFRVRGSNHDGVWNDEGVSLRVLVRPPPWKTWWAYLLYGLAVAAAIGMYVRYRIMEREKELQTLLRIEQAKAEEREVVRKNTAADFHDELGNKMTRISLFVELARRGEGLSDTVRTYLNQVEANTQQLSHGIRDFIWALDPDKDSVYDLLIRIKDFGEELFRYTEVRFSSEGIHPRQSELKLPLDDRRHLVLIAKEAMNNALKYADARHVWLRISGGETSLNIQIEDDGKGFDLEARNSGYGLNNMRNRASKIGAKTEIRSAPGKGTQIEIKLNIPDMGDS